MIELQVAHARMKSEIMQILTADQKAKLAQIEAQKDARMQEHMKSHMSPPPAD
jgi:Spy/CpxP family protein refolding chaperone